MSGLAVIVNRTGDPVPHEVVEPIRRSLTHRGPDGIHVERDRNVAMIHARLVTTPEAAFERQPFRTAGGDWHVADVRIDNRAELIEALRWDRPATTTTDVELLAEAHRTWGTRLGEHVVGDFAAIIVEGTGRVTCIRDHLGVKPLYYWCSPRWIVIASGMREISAHPEAPRTLDVQMMGEYLSGWVEDSEATAVEGIRRLPAASVMTIDGEVRVRRHWMPPLEDPIELADLSAYGEEFRRLFTEAVSCRLRTAGPVASELSGGLDSTSVTALASQLITAGTVEASTLRVYSCIFPDSPRSDERSFIDSAVRELGLDWEPVVDTPARAPWVDESVEFWADIPLPPDGPAHQALGRSAAGAGCKVVLTGHGGDDWFDASPVALAALVDRRRLGLAWTVARRWSGGAAGPAARTLVKRGLLPHKPAWVRRYRTRRAPWVVGPARRAARLDQRRVPGVQDRRHRRVLAQWRYESLTDGYAAMEKEILDRIAAWSGVESRHPYLDKRLVELASRTPITAHVTADHDRALQRSGLRGLVPAEIVERRSKASFGEVWHREIDRQLGGSLRTLPVEVGWIDGDAAAGLWRSTTERVLAGAGGGSLFALWGILQVDSLLRHFDRPPTG